MLKSSHSLVWLPGVVEAGSSVGVGSFVTTGGSVGAGVGFSVATGGEVADAVSEWDGEAVAFSFFGAFVFCGFVFCGFAVVFVFFSFFSAFGFFVGFGVA